MTRLVSIAHRYRAARCAYCHGPVEGHEAVEACAGCDTLLHRECRVEHGRCPTAGCTGTSPPGARQAIAVESPLPPRARAAGLGGVYRQLALRATLHGLIAALCLAALAWVFSHPVLVWELAREGKSGAVESLPFALVKVLFLGLWPPGFLLWFTGSWLRRAPAVWRRVGQLLDTLPVQRRLAIRNETRGKEATHADFRGPQDTLSVPVPPLSGLKRRDGARVLVYGERPGPWLLEFYDGTLYLLEPDDVPAPAPEVPFPRPRRGTRGRKRRRRRRRRR